jgi:hypothetical protein
MKRRVGLVVIALSLVLWVCVIYGLYFLSDWLAN